MKRAIIAITMAVLWAGTAYAQDTSMKPAGGDNQIHSITLPNVSVKLKDGENRMKVETYCAVCHSTDYITMQPRFSKAQWTGTVNKMIKTFGAPIPQEDAEKIISYLAAEYGTGK